MVKCDFCDALTEAEKACRDALARTLKCRVYRYANPGEPDCAAFDAGWPQTGEMHLCGAKSYHWRATLTIWRRDHDELQREIMQLLETLPVNADLAADDDLRKGSNVISLRLAPEVQAVSGISTTEVTPARGGAAVPCYRAEAKFDLVFAARFE